MRVRTGDPTASIAVQSAGYPISDPRFVSNSVVSNGGAFWFYCPPMFTVRPPGHRTAALFGGEAHTPSRCSL